MTIKKVTQRGVETASREDPEASIPKEREEPRGGLGRLSVEQCVQRFQNVGRSFEVDQRKKWTLEPDVLIW
jgi:hypothetical protein